MIEAFNAIALQIMICKAIRTEVYDFIVREHKCDEGFDTYNYRTKFNPFHF